MKKMQPSVGKPVSNRYLDVLLVGQMDSILLKGRLATHVKVQMSECLTHWSNQFRSKNQYIRTDSNIYNKPEQSCFSIF